MFLSVVIIYLLSIHKITFLELSISGNINIEAVDIPVPLRRQMSASGTPARKKIPSPDIVEQVYELNPIPNGPL